MFVRISIETVLLREATRRVTFFSISVGKKNKRESTELEEERGGYLRKGRCCDEGAVRSRNPFSLYKESATGARWLCAFLKHQLPEWSCHEAMHCGTGVSDFVTIFDCLLLKIFSLLFMVLWCVSHTYSFCGDMFSAVSLPLLLFW